jgi:uncharacterized protein (DUF362 family)
LVKNEVSIVRVKEGLIEEAVRRAIDLAGGIKRTIKSHDRVFIKPNAVVPLSHSTGVVTNPAVIKALVKIALEAGAERVIVGDSPFIAYKSREVLTKIGIVEAAQDAGAEIAYLDEEPYEEVGATNAKIMNKIRLPKSFLSCNVFITAPKMKTHNQTVVSLSIKNQHGLLRAEDKRIMHRDDIHQKIVDITGVAKPNLIIIDGTVALEGQGPTYGSPVETNLILAGTNVVSCDAVASSLMGFEPESITSLRLAQMQGFGTLDVNEISIKGENLNNVRVKFKKPSTEVVGVFPHVNVYVGGPCQSGCYAWTRVGLDGMKRHGVLDKVKGNINIIMGVSPTVPEKLDGRTFVIGDCAAKHKDKGIFIPGCPPFDTWRMRTYFSDQNHKQDI